MANSLMLYFVPDLNCFSPLFIYGIGNQHAHAIILFVFKSSKFITQWHDYCLLK